MRIPTDPDSITKCIKRIHYQVFIWNQCNKQVMKSVSFETNYWTWCPDFDIVMPVWLLDDQISNFTKANNK